MCADLLHPRPTWLYGTVNYTPSLAAGDMTAYLYLPKLLYLPLRLVTTHIQTYPPPLSHTLTGTGRCADRYGGVAET